MFEGIISNLPCGTTAGELDIIVSRWAEQKKNKWKSSFSFETCSQKSRIERKLKLAECNAKGWLQPNPERGAGHHQQVHLENKQTKKEKSVCKNIEVKL